MCTGTFVSYNCGHAHMWEEAQCRLLQEGSYCKTVTATRSQDTNGPCYICYSLKDRSVAKDKECGRPKRQSDHLQAIAKQALIDHVSTITREVVDRLMLIEGKEKADRKGVIMAELTKQIQSGLDDIQSERDLNTELERATTKCWIKEVKEGKKTLEEMEQGMAVADAIVDAMRLSYVKDFEREILEAVGTAFERL